MQKILAFLLMTCVSGTVLAGFVEGEKAFKEERWPLAYAEFSPLAASGDFRAQYYLGYLLLNGYGTVKDEKKAADYFSKAAEQEYDMAQAMMGYLHAEGIGIRKNKKKAIEFYEAAAAQGNGDALLNLGVMYYTGDSVSKDVKQAVDYFSKVSPAEKPVVAKYLGDIYLNETSLQDPKKAFDYYMIAAHAGDVEAYHALGKMYQDGAHVTKDIGEAIKFYSFAASKGFEPSLYALGVIYSNADGVTRDVYTAHAYFSLAAAKDMKEAKKAKELLESDMSLSEREKASRAKIKVQQENLKSPSAPLTEDKKVENAPTVSKRIRTTIRRRRR